MHLAVWPQHTLNENWGLFPFGGRELRPHLTQCGQGRGYPYAKFHFDPSTRMAAIHKHHRQDRQTDRTNNGPIA